MEQTAQVRVSETVYENIKNAKIEGICIHINHIGYNIILSYSSITNCEYLNGALNMKNGNSISMTNVCFDRNKGRTGSHFCDSIGYGIASVLTNNTNEQSEHSFHGSMVSGRKKSHFCYNNQTHSIVQSLSPWHFISENQESVTSFCQVSNTRSQSIASWNSIGSAFNLVKFNFLNCSCNEVNDLINGSGQMKYTGCVFLIECSGGLGSYSLYDGCYSNMAFSTEGIYSGDQTIDIQLSAICVKRYSKCADFFFKHILSKVYLAFLYQCSNFGFLMQ